MSARGCSRLLPATVPDTAVTKPTISINSSFIKGNHRLGFTLDEIKNRVPFVVGVLSERGQGLDVSSEATGVRRARDGYAPTDEPGSL
jgi:hypothetical protein